MEGRIEKVLLSHSGRGMDILRKHLREDYCREAAAKLLERPKGTVLLTTGFYVNGAAETDGPPGTMVLAKALEKIGYQPVIITDAYCKGFFEICQLAVEYVDTQADAETYDRLFEVYQPVALISIERCGKNRKGDYANMRGESILDHTAQTDLLFEQAAERGIFTIGVGDGGNEIGMGNLKDVITQKLSLEPCVVSVDRLVVATVSNWGAYGLTAYLQKLSGKRVFPRYEEIRDYIKAIVKLGSVDGVTKKCTPSVDSFPPTIEKEIVDSLSELTQTA